MIICFFNQKLVFTCPVLLELVDTKQHNIVKQSRAVCLQCAEWAACLNVWLVFISPAQTSSLVYLSSLRDSYKMLRVAQKVPFVFVCSKKTNRKVKLSLGLYVQINLLCDKLCKLFRLKHEPAKTSTTDDKDTTVVSSVCQLHKVSHQIHKSADL